MRAPVIPTLTAIRTVRAPVTTRLGNTRWQRVGRIRADWSGGAYIDLTFTDSLSGHISSNPTEVINVWDYENGEIEIPFTQPDLAAELARWITAMNVGPDDPDYWPSWFADYLENARW